MTHSIQISRCIILIVVLILSISNLQSDPVDKGSFATQIKPFKVTDSMKSEPIDLSPHLEILEDPTRSIELDEILTGQLDHTFTRGYMNSPGFGFSDSFYWVRVRLQNQSTKYNQFYLIFEEPLVDFLTYYIPSDQGYKKFTGGDLEKKSKIQIPDEVYVAPVQMKKGESVEILIHIQSGYTVIPLRLVHGVSYKDYTDLKHLLLGLSYGIIIALAIYNFVLYFGAWDLIYLSYSGYHVSALLLYITFNGLGMRYFWGEYPIFANYLVPITTYLMILMASIFARLYMNLQRTQKWMDRIILFFIYYALVMIPVSLLLPINLAAQIGSLSGLVNIIFVLIAIIISMLQGHRPSRILFVAWLTYIAGIILYVARGNAILPDNIITNNSMQVGSSLEAILMAIAVSFRMRDLRNQKEAAVSELQTFHYDLETARRIQESLLPKKTAPISSRDFSIHYEYHPMQMVGGDFIAIEEYEDNKLCILIADVSGHGIPAALMASSIRTIFKAQKENYGSPAKVLSQINYQLYDQLRPESHFLTAQCIFLDPDEDQVVLASAGHPPLLHIRDGKIHKRNPVGKGLGFDKKIVLEQQQFDLSNGDRFVLYTDGLIEGSGDSGDFENRFYELLKKHSSIGNTALVKIIFDEYRAWAKNPFQEDDITLLVIDHTRKSE